MGEDQREPGREDDNDKVQRANKEVVEGAQQIALGSWNITKAFGRYTMAGAEKIFSYVEKKTRPTKEKENAK